MRNTYMTARHPFAAAAFAALLACAPLAQAHNVWLEPDADGAYTVQFGGHEGKLENW